MLTATTHHRRSAARAGGLASGHARGFTLIEVLVGTSIAALLASTALPSCLDAVRKGRRSTAIAAIAAVQQAQERWRGNNGSYSLSLVELRVAEPAGYALAIAAPGADAASLSKGYVVTAEGRGAQAADPRCQRLSVRLLDGQLAYAACDNCSSFSYSTVHPCFGR